MRLYPWGVLDSGTAQNALLVGGNRQKTPMADRLHSVLREPLRDLIARDESYDALFDRLEYFLALKHLDLNSAVWAPIGRFGWHDGERRIFSRLLDEASAEGSSWPPIAAGLFDSPERFAATHARFREGILPHLRQWAF